MDVDPIKEFSNDHYLVRDLLLKLIEYIENKDVVNALETLIQLDKLGGPHFRFEEETLYPMLERFFGPEYYEYLLSAHDRVIKAARRISEVLSRGELDEEQSRELVSLIRRDILPHPIECEGLTLLIEKLNTEELNKIAESIKKAREEAVPLIEWANTIRKRKV